MSQFKGHTGPLASNVCPKSLTMTEY